MSHINKYDITALDLSLLKNLFQAEGTEKQFKKHEYLLRQDEPCRWVGYVVKGICRLTHINAAGNERVVGYSPAGHFVTDYTACLCKHPSTVNIRAVTECNIQFLPYTTIETFWNASAENQQLGRHVAEQLFAMTYRRLVESYCTPPEERYLNFIRHYPDLKEQIPLKEIASFIGVTPETVSKIRKKILQQSKS